MKIGCLFIIALSLLTINCAHSPDRYHCEYTRHRAAIQRILILPPEIDLLANGPDGRLLRLDTQSRRAVALTQQAMAQTLSDHGFVAKMIDDHLLKTEEVVSLRSLYRNVNRAIQLHAYGPQVFPAKTKALDYALGSVSGLLAAGEADALLLILGRQTQSAQKERSWISLAMVEPAGNIIWYGVRGNISQTTRQPQQVFADLVHLAIQPFLEGGS